MARIPPLVRYGLLLAACCAFSLPSCAQSYAAGESYFDEDKTVEFIPGDMPLVITAPHGGTAQPWGVPDRVQGCAGGKRIVTLRDSNTAELARKIQQDFFDMHGVRPYIIVAHISRTKIDLNRDLDEAACGNAAMEKVWRSWHGFVHTAMSMAAERFGGVLYIDLHGHANPRQRIELGYLLRPRKLQSLYGNSSPSEMRQPSRSDEDGEAAPTGSLHSLVNFPALKSGQKTLHQMLFGEDAIGTLLTLDGLAAVPSRQDPVPDSGQIFFSGGYNTARYTGAQYPAAFGWQMETPRDARQSAAQAQTARAIVSSLARFMTINTGLKWTPGVAAK